jgi:hypothetical protein
MYSLTSGDMVPLATTKSKGCAKNSKNIAIRSKFFP